MIDIKPFCVTNGKKFSLKRYKTVVPPLYISNKHYNAHLSECVDQIDKLQYKLAADDRYSVLLVLQAMDAAGKDGIIRHVLTGVNPQGCQIFSFKAPSSEELKHDFLWRTAVHLPERGRVGIFNRSYYEEVLVAKVHPEILEAQRLPEEVMKDKNFWNNRYESIVDHEKHLDRNGIKVVKIFLNVSKDEQRKRFIERIDDPDKNWKFSQGDIDERGFWDSYMTAFDTCIKNTSTTFAPWYVVPADDKRNARLIVAQILRDTLSALPLKFPQGTKERQKELQYLRRLLTTEAATKRKR